MPGWAVEVCPGSWVLIPCMPSKVRRSFYPRPALGAIQTENDTYRIKVPSGRDAKSWTTRDGDRASRRPWFPNSIRRRTRRGGGRAESPTTSGCRRHRRRTRAFGASSRITWRHAPHGESTSGWSEVITSVRISSVPCATALNRAIRSAQTVSPGSRSRCCTRIDLAVGANGDHPYPDIGVRAPRHLHRLPGETRGLGRRSVGSCPFSSARTGR